MATPTDPIEALLQRLLLLQRAGNTIAEDTKDRIRRLFEAIERDLRRLDPTGVAPRYREGRRRKFEQRLRQRVRAFAKDYEGALKDQLAPLGRQQAEAARDGLIATLGETGERVVRNTPITQNRIRAILNAQPFRGRTLRGHARRLGANTVDRISVQVRLGMANEESIGDIVRRVRGEQAGFIRRDPKTGAFVPKGTRGAIVRPRFTGGVWQTTTRDAEAVVRTAVTHVSNVGMMETFRENEQVVKHLVFTSVLDDRTTVLCASLDQTTWPLDSPDIQQPPLHWNCRSVLTPQMDWESLGLDPPPEGERFARDLSGVEDEDLSRKVSARRRTGDFGKRTDVPSRTRYEQWLRDQRPAVQNRVLGKERAELWRAGEVSNLKELIAGDNSLVPLERLLRN